MEIGFNIRELRNQSGLTILELAKLAGVSGESVRVLENSNSPKTITVLVKVLSALGFELRLDLVRQ